ncbi:50S ribosomal protein L11 methyltransferase [Edaphobacillus lindanitolerans]|uniref:Ribosomal protein L11 methyltransferase n=1 Tax=Edaphobacillus lindanitolerans TaxID=550447 RepID=A0A1U7PJQ7_9BACI|nr:50S ribosomal protein L11 methyltransferase [Edaphobacillus lindanitolerans]SIT82431.1 ribosomal protein L11 methyltransferase [Edaphobacillus lindanitolerans]
MKWSEIAVHTTNEAAEAVSNILHEAGASGVVIEDSCEPDLEREDRFGELYDLDREDYPEDGVILKAYLPVSSFLMETIGSLKRKITGLSEYGLDTGRNTVSMSEVDEEDWATSWKAYYHPVKVSRRFTIVPTWEDYERLGSDELIIELDPGMAFGTGTHPTTVLCLQALEKTVREGDVIVDIGTGSGVLSIGAALLGAGKVTALDLDEVAVKAAKDNVALNGLSDEIDVRQGNLLEAFEGTANIAVANILAEVIVTFTDDAYRVLEPGGLFITSGIISRKKDEVKEALRDSGFEIEEVMVMEDWTAIIAKKPSAGDTDAALLP